MKTKKITISDREVTFALDGAFPITYTEETGREFYSDIIGLTQLAVELQKGNLSGLDVKMFYDMVYLMAKNNAPELPEMKAWLKTFDEFPIFEIVGEIMPFIIDNVVQKNRKIVKKK